MNHVFLYTIWQRVEDLVLNPKFDPEGDPDNPDYEPELILDPNNASGTRYQAIKCVDNLDVAKSVCELSNGEYIYTYQQAWFGMSD